jgi:hypothetical protein
MEKAMRHPIVFEWTESRGGLFKTLLIVCAILIAFYAIGARVIGEPFITAFSDVISIMHE